MKISLYKVEDKLITLLRISLAIIFVWFGVLKIAGVSPATSLVAGIFPILAGQEGIFWIGIAEVVVGLIVFFNRFQGFANLVLALHLLTTLLLFFTAPGMMFEPKFPMLSLEGEFVLKNISLVVAALVVLVHERRKARHS